MIFWWSFSLSKWTFCLCFPQLWRFSNKFSSNFQAGSIFFWKFSCCNFKIEDLGKSLKTMFIRQPKCCRYTLWNVSGWILEILVWVITIECVKRKYIDKLMLSLLSSMAASVNMFCIKFQFSVETSTRTIFVFYRVGINIF